MTLDDFRQLCHDQWTGPVYGDVAKLWLTDDSAAELTIDVLSDPSSAMPYTISAVSRVESAGTSTCITRLVNPITRNTVTITPGNPGDIAVVNHGAHSPAELIEL